MIRVSRSGTALLMLSTMVACGGGGSGGRTIAGGGGGGSYSPGVFQPSSTFAAQCAMPRTGNNPRTGQPYPDRQGSATAEKHWIRSWSNELYLWYRELPDIDPATRTVADYFTQMKTSQLSPSGQPKDKFHFTYDTAAWEALSQSGVEAGYGVQWAVIASLPPRRIVVAYTEPGYPASTAPASLTRGAEIIAVDGADAVNGSTQSVVDTLNAGLFPDTSGETHSFTVRELNGTTRTVTMQSTNVTYTPVQNVGTIATASGPVGYMLFNDHVATAEPALRNAVTTLAAGNITDLVLDIRYNGGGYLDIASELAWMIAGNTRTAGQPFERIVFNDKYPTTNPVTGQALAPTPFHTTTQGFVGPAGQPLPALNLPRVFVLTGPNTCSASEAIMNGLRGVGVEVIQIGSTTCGKPYGFYARDNCGTTYFSIQFKGENAAAFGDYSDGFSPDNQSGVVGVRVPGCSVADDFTHALGDPNESRLAAALAWRAGNGTCPAASGFAPGMLGKPGQSLDAADGVLYKSPWRENRWLRDQT